jgi:protein-S-isoprenylcysteine O-methyltransferase Ste14
MTAGHLLFALVTTAYIVVGTRIEERDLARMLGDEYHRYRARTARFLPRPQRPKAGDVEAVTAKA